MMLLHFLFMAALLEASNVTPVATQQPVPQEGVCEQSDSADEWELHDAQVILGVISSVDRSTGLVTLKTDAGWIEMAASIEDLKGFQEGDMLVVCLEEEPSKDDDILVGPFIV